MNNVEMLKEMISKLAECHLTSIEDTIPAYLASIATSLAVIADKMTEEEEISKRAEKTESEKLDDIIVRVGIQNIYDLLTRHTALLNDIKMMLPSTEKIDNIDRGTGMVTGATPEEMKGED